MDIICSSCKFPLDKQHVVYTALLWREGEERVEFLNLFLYRCPECKRLSFFELEG